jgi:hypothetical protein
MSLATNFAGFGRVADRIIPALFLALGAATAAAVVAVAG